jgi:hypothetical protein
MVTVEALHSLTQGFPEVELHPHFHKTAFKVRKKIFCTLDAEAGTAVVKLNEIDQSAFCAFDADVIRPVNGAWGKMGWTEILLDKVLPETFDDILRTAYCTVAPAKLAQTLR